MSDKEPPSHRFCAVVIFTVYTIASLASSAQAGPFDKCADELPFGVPKMAVSGDMTPVCHLGYAALVDNKTLVPRWVAYHLTGKHSLGCLKRTDDFHVEDAAPAGHASLPKDYEHSGYDQGHQAPADDFGWSGTAMHDSFSMANMAPQLHSLNAAQWKNLEEHVRAWALERGELQIYVGPIIGSHDKKIGADKVDVPIAFWKVIVDPKRKVALAFEMKHEAISYGDLSDQQVTIDAVERDAKIVLPMPRGVNEAANEPIWDADTAAWRLKKKAACSVH